MLNPFWRDVVAHTHTFHDLTCFIYIVVWLVLLHIRFHAWSLYHCVFILCHDFWPWNLHEAFSRGYFLPLTAPRTAVIFFTALGQRFSDRADRSRTAAWPLPLSAAVGLTGANRCRTAAYLAAVWQRSSMTFRFPKAKTTSFLLGVLYKYHLLPSSFLWAQNQNLEWETQTLEREAPKNSPLLNQTTSHVHLASS